MKQKRQEMAQEFKGHSADSLGQTDAELRRLIDRAALMENETRRQLIEAGIGPGLRVVRS